MSLEVRLMRLADNWQIEYNNQDEEIQKNFIKNEW